MVVEEGLAVPNLHVIRAEETWIEGCTRSMSAVLELCTHPGEVLSLFLNGASDGISRVALQLTTRPVHDV